MKKIITLALILAASSVWATGNDHDDPDQQQEQSQDQTQTTIVNIGGGVDGQAAGPLATAAGGTSSATVAEGAVQVNNVREAQGDYEVKFRNNPNVYTNAPAPTISCYKTGGGGASGGGVGLSFGGGKIDPYCVKREEIRLGFAIGMTVQARFAWCNLENNVELFMSIAECLSADTSVVSGEYQLLLKEKERLERELRETQTVIANRCAQAEEGQERAEEAWLECQAGK